MRITTRSLQRVVELRLKLAGIEIKMGPHGLRHSFATHMLQNGADIVTIGECLGHASLSTTQKYTHLAMVDIIDAYNIGPPRGVTAKSASTGTAIQSSRWTKGGNWLTAVERNTQD